MDILRSSIFGGLQIEEPYERYCHIHHDPIYKGDPNTQKSRLCAYYDCSTREQRLDRKLKRCGRCSQMWYCSAEHQKADYGDHKEFCKEIAALKKQKDDLAAPLKAYKGMLGTEPPTNLFRTSVGDFYGIFDTRDYMRARLELAESLYHHAYHAETKDAWESALKQYLELLRLCQRDNMGIRFKVPFVLFYLNRDDDAYAFLKYWVEQEQEEEEYEQRDHLHKSSSKGDWIYPRQKDCRYEDLFKNDGDKSYRHTSLHFLVAACIVKLRNIANYETKMRVIQKGINKPGIKKPVLTASDTAVAEDQRKQLTKLFHIIDRNNPSMLPSIINPSPFKSQFLPEYTVAGSPAEAYLVLNECNRIFVRIPGAEEMLKERYGAFPSYNHTL